ncbi:hypothetical protein LOK49_LG12G02922 [Camellia lanceoleosa]|uniref:Uncharacterized protein n=1 Tax=Camellia lanceoleosa TaxID=1840588 RepID=A0ACC0FSF9_9ERIC|nr:hypothetical protein LOK49_LG12G02922 [Camellia lanceoleosa]
MDVEAMDVEENPLRRRRRNVLCVEKKARIKFTEKSFEPEEGEEEEKVKQGYTSLQIGGGLKELLYRGEFHDNLPTGVMVSRSQIVKFVNLTSFASLHSQVDFEAGLKKDIEDFKQLVLKIKLSRNSTAPVVLTLFCCLCDDAQLTTGVELVNAFFHDDNDRCYLFMSVWDFIKGDLHKGLSILHFNKGVVNMRRWRSTLRDLRFSALKRAS